MCSKMPHVLHSPEPPSLSAFNPQCDKEIEQVQSQLEDYKDPPLSLSRLSLKQQKFKTFREMANVSDTKLWVFFLRVHTCYTVLQNAVFKWWVHLLGEKFSKSVWKSNCHLIITPGCATFSSNRCNQVLWSLAMAASQEELLPESHSKVYFLFFFISSLMNHELWP